MRTRISFSLLTFLVVFGATATMASAETMCVYDPSGRNGEAFILMKDYQTAAAGWGVNFTLKPYTDEKIAAQDFKANKCDAVVLTGVRARAFNKFSGTIDSMGSLPTYKHLKSLLKTLARKKAGKRMRNKNYETIAVFPGGAVYLFVNDKSINSAEAIAGKRLATLEYDKAAKVMVKKVGGSGVAADLGTFAGKFNNGNVAICYAPATAYHALELYKGIGEKGGVLEYPLAQLTFQIVTRTGAFTPEFAHESRKWSLANFDRFLKLSKQAERNIPKKHWVSISQADKVRYDQMFQDTRVELRDKHRVFHKTTLALMLRIRCNIDASRAECTTKPE